MIVTFNTLTLTHITDTLKLKWIFLVFRYMYVALLIYKKVWNKLNIFEDTSYQSSHSYFVGLICKYFTKQQFLTRNNHMALIKTDIDKVLPNSSLIKVPSLKISLLPIMLLWGDLKTRSHANDLMSWTFNDMINTYLFWPITLPVASKTI